MPKKTFSRIILILFFVVATKIAYPFFERWKVISDNSKVTTEAQVQKDIYDISVLKSEDDETGLHNLKKQIAEASTGRKGLDSTLNAVVKIRSPWAEGYGFFISERGHILTSKSLVSFEKDEDDPEWRKQQQLVRRLERLNKDIEELENNLSYKRLSNHEIDKTEELLEKKKEKVAEVEDNLNMYDSDITVLATDGTPLYISDVYESEHYEVVLLTIEDTISPSLKPILAWPTKKFYYDLNLENEKIYAIGNKKGKKTIITPTRIYNFRENGKCCYSYSMDIQFDEFSTIGAPLLNEKGEILGLCYESNWGNGKAIPILTILEEFKENLGIVENE